MTVDGKVYIAHDKSSVVDGGGADKSNEEQANSRSEGRVAHCEATKVVV